MSKKSIFISYSQSDRVIARLIYHHFKRVSNEALFLFLDEFSILPGEDIRGSVEKAISQCDLGIVILSEQASSSGFVPQEIGLLAARKIPLIFVSINERVQTPPGFQSFNRSFPLFNYLDPNEGLQELYSLVKQYISFNEIDEAFLLQKCRQSINKGNFEELLSYSSLIIEHFPENVMAYMHKSHALLRTRRYNECDSFLHEATAKLEFHPSMIARAAACFKAMKKNELAIHYHKKYLDYFPDDQECLYRIGLCYEDLKMVDDALASFEHSYRLNPLSKTGIFSKRHIDYLLYKRKKSISDMQAEINEQADISDN